MGTVAYAVPFLYRLSNLPHRECRAVTLPPILFAPYFNSPERAVTYSVFRLSSYLWLLV